MAKTTNEKLPNMKQFGDGLTAVQNMIAGVASAAAGSFEEVYENLAGKAISGTLTASSGNGSQGRIRLRSKNIPATNIRANH